MANITIAVDREALKRARIRAIEEGTSVNAILGELSSLRPTPDRQVNALRPPTRYSRPRIPPALQAMAGAALAKSCMSGDA